MMMPMYGIAAGKVPLLLIALAAGYTVLTMSQGQKRPLDVLGRIVGGLILVVSFVGLLCVAACALRWCGKSAMCSYPGKSAGCAMSMAGTTQNDTPPPQQ